MADTIAQLKDRFGESVLLTHSFRGDDTALVTRDVLLSVATFLKEELGFNMLTDETVVDLLQMEPDDAFFPAGDRFEYVAHFYSISRNVRVRIKTRCPEGDPTLPSLYSLYKSANFMEREIYDLYGVTFEGHPDMRRILLYDEFEGHPLRKDYPYDKEQPVIPMRTDKDS